MKKERIIYLSILVVISVAAITLFRVSESVQLIADKQYWIYKTHSTEKYPVVIAGDSRVFRGISPKEFEDAYTGMSAINLGYSSNGYHPEYLDFLEERLDKSVENPVILLGISSHSFSRNGSGSWHFRSEVNTKKEEVIQYMNYYSFVKMFYPLDILKAFHLGGNEKYGQKNQFTYHSDGWMESTRVYRDTNISISSYKVIFKDNQFIENSAGILYRQVQKWTDEDIIVAAFRSPTTHGVRVLEDSLSGFDVEPFKHALIESGAHWIELERKKYQTYDGNHLDSESARLLSRDLVAEIREIIESSD